MPAQSKFDQVAQINERIDASAGLFVIGYYGLTVEQSQDLRHKLREVGAEMKVLKNTLVKIALKEKEQPALDDILAGPTACIFFEKEPVEAAKVLKDFAAATKDVITIKGGISEGKAVTAEQVQAIADLPTRDQLLSMVLQAALGPATGAVRVINGPIQGLINVLDAIKDQKAA